MCEHIKDKTGKKRVFVSGLCRQCKAQEKYDQKQFQLLIKRSRLDYRRLAFLKEAR